MPVNLKEMQSFKQKCEWLYWALSIYFEQGAVKGAYFNDDDYDKKEGKALKDQIYLLDRTAALVR